MTVQFHSLRDIREFVGLATLQSYPIHVADAAGATADAKCFMEMFTVEFTQPLTLLIGAEDGDVERAKEIIRRNSSTRQKTVPTNASFGRGLAPGDTVVETNVTGATVFVLGVESFEKL